MDADSYGAHMRLIKMLAIALLVYSTNLVAAQEVVELKPEMRVEPLTDALDYIDIEKISSYLENIVIFKNNDEYKDLPYILSFDKGADMGASHDIAYSIGINSEDNISAYTLLMPGETLVDPDTKETLGFYADVIGSAEVQRWGSPQTLLIQHALTSIERGHRIIPRIGLDLPSIIALKRPVTPMSGRVLSVENENVGVGAYSIAILNLGIRDGAQRGDLIDILEAPVYSRDPITSKDVLLPTEKFGKLMIYKTFDKISLAIVIESNRPVIIGDQIIGTPA